jgi:hypothetical protein
VVEAPQRGGQGRGEAGRHRMQSGGRGGDVGERGRVVEREAAASLGLARTRMRKRTIAAEPTVQIFLTHWEGSGLHDVRWEQ